MRVALVVLFLLVSGAALWGDAVILNDGTRLEGRIQREGMGWVVTDASGKATSVGDEQVKMVEKSSNLTPEQLASADLASLRRDMDDVTDPKLAIAGYQKFLEQNKGKPVAADAEAELKIWQDRQASGAVKLGSRWMTPAQRDEALRQIASMLDDIKPKIDAGKLKDAEEALKKVMAIVPDYPGTLYLQGTVDYKQKQFSAAKKDLEKAVARLKDHGPTLNNLAVVDVQQKLYTLALNSFDSAMQARPKDRLILDNVAQALHDLPDSEQGTALAKRVSKRFQEQDGELQKQLKDNGLVRWGATYITTDQMDEVTKAQDASKGKLSDLNAELKKEQDHFTQIQKQLEASNREMQRAAANPRRGNRGAAYRKQNDKLKGEAADANKKIQDLRRQIQSAEDQGSPYPKYPGQYKLFGTDAAPAELGAGADKPQ